MYAWEKLLYASCLEIVKNVAVSILLKTSFIEKLVKGIFPAESNISQHSTQPVLILVVHEALVDN